MTHPDSYIGHLLNGREPGDIEDWVERWHTSNSNTELHAFLGMTTEEYVNWVTAPDSLEHIIAIRRLVEAAKISVTAAVARSKTAN